MSKEKVGKKGGGGPLVVFTKLNDILAACDQQTAPLSQHVTCDQQTAPLSQHVLFKQ